MKKFAGSEVKSSPLHTHPPLSKREKNFCIYDNKRARRTAADCEGQTLQLVDSAKLPKCQRTLQPNFLILIRSVPIA